MNPKKEEVCFPTDCSSVAVTTLSRKKEGSDIRLIKTSVETDHCVFVMRYDDPMATEWKRKTDPIFDIVECLTDASVKEWEEQYPSNEDAYYEEEEDDD